MQKDISIFSLAILVVCCWLPLSRAETQANAGTIDQSVRTLRLDVETDPLAFALAGNSLHVGVSRRHWRLDFGSFGVRLPAFVVGNDKLDVRFDGFGAKLQYFLDPEQRGVFFGLDSSVVRVAVSHAEMNLAKRFSQVGAGVQIGYRFSLGQQAYISPWLGISYQFGARDVTLADDRYAAQRIGVFPTIHIGYRWR